MGKDQKLKARERRTIKNTSDGLVELNETTGEEIRISSRDTDLDLRGGTAEPEPLSQAGKRQNPGAPLDAPVSVAKRRQTYRHSKTDTVTETQPSVTQYPDDRPARHDLAEPAEEAAIPGPEAQPHTAHGADARALSQQPGVSRKTLPSKGKRQSQAADTPRMPTQDAAAGFPTTDKLPIPAAAVITAPKTDAPALKTGKQSRLMFTPDEAAPETPKNTHNRKLAKAQAQAGRAAGKLEKARDSLPAKHTPHRATAVDEKSGAASKKLRFEKTPISQGAHIKGALPLRPVKLAGNALIVNAHRKVFQAEHENVGIKAAHRAEMVAEGGIRTALRFRKTAPYRKAAKLEQAAHKKSANFAYQQALADNPKLKSNILSRAMQKRKIKKDYAKAARETQKAAKRAKEAGSATARAAKAVFNFFRRHPIISVIVLLLALLIISMASLIGSLGGLAGGGLSTVASSTYLAPESEIYAAQAAYAGMEAGLQHELDNYEALHPGYDEYRFDLDAIWHDPYALISILSALHDGEWTLGEVQGALAMLFERQYILTETVTVETRYRTETTSETDPITGETYESSYDVAYNYYICTVTLENFNLSHLPIYIMGEDALSRYALYMATLGNRPDLFPVSLYPDASYYRDYGRHDIPQAYLDADPVFAAMIKEANRYLGMPYVWGGYSPKTSFDCSGYVSWVLNNSGWDIGRLTAQGLYNISAPVSASDARPGDLIFFHSTYKAAYAVTHVGIYVGDGMMVHCGNPIGYVSIETPYWQQHLYAYGRVY